MSEHTNVAAPDVWRLVCGDWKDATVAIHNNAGHIVCGLDPAKAIVDAHNMAIGYTECVSVAHCSKKAGQVLSMCEIVVMCGHRNQPARS